MKYLQRLQMQLVKGKSHVKKSGNESEMEDFFKDLFIKGMNFRYRSLMEARNLDGIKRILFEELRQQAFEIDKRNLRSTYP